MSTTEGIFLVFKPHRGYSGGVTIVIDKLDGNTVSLEVEEDGLIHRSTMSYKDLETYISVLVRCTAASRNIKTVECSFPGFPSYLYVNSKESIEALVDMTRVTVKSWS